MIGNLLTSGFVKFESGYLQCLEQNQRMLIMIQQRQMSDNFRPGYGFTDVSPPYRPLVKVIYRSKPTLWGRLRGCFA